MSIMRTNGNGKVIITATPKGVGNFKDLYMNGKKLKIENYTKDLNMMVIYGWDVLAADETEDNYLFQLALREDPKVRVYITLGRELQYAELPYYPEMMYQCYIHDDEGKWDNRSWFRAHDLTYKNFWSVVEEIVDKHNPILPF